MDELSEWLAHFAEKHDPFYALHSIRSAYNGGECPIPDCTWLPKRNVMPREFENKEVAREEMYKILVQATGRAPTSEERTAIQSGSVPVGSSYLTLVYDKKNEKWRVAVIV